MPEPLAWDTLHQRYRTRETCQNKAIALLQQVESGGDIVNQLGPDRVIAMAAVYAQLARS